MIFIVSDEFLLLERALLPGYAAAVENLITAHSQGWHVFAPGREVGELFLSELGMSPNKRDILRHHIVSRAAELTGQARSVARVIYCVPDGSADLGLDERCLVVPLSVFADMEPCLKSELLVENARRDGEFYITLAQVLGSAGGRIPLRLDVVNGGGNTTADELGRRAGNVRPLLAIIDGDRRSPGGAAGETMRRVEEVAEQVTNPLAFIVYLDVRSLENFVPLEEWRRACANDEDACRAIRALETTREFEIARRFGDDRSLLRFYSFKRALRSGDYRRSDPQFREVLRFYIGERGGVDPTDLAEGEDNDAQELLPRVAGHALDRVLDHLKAHHSNVDRLIADLQPHPCWPSLRRILQQVIAFGLGGSRIAAAGTN